MNIWDVYNKLKNERDMQRTLVAVLERENYEPEMIETVRGHELFLTRLMKDIDVASHRPTEDDEA